MIVEKLVGLIEINPTLPPTQQPIIDSYTKKLTAALRGKKTVGLIVDGVFIPGIKNFSVYSCTCGANFGSCDFKLDNGFYANSLSLHYLAYHRQEIPIEILNIIGSFVYGKLEPVQSELF